jgi:hypothetical protein
MTRGFLLPHTVEITSAYERGESVNRIAKKFQCDNSTVWTLLRNNGIKKHPLLLHDVKDEVFAMYLAGSTLTEVGEKFGTSFVVVQSLLKKFGIPIRPLSEACRTYSVNETYFEKIDTQAKAYWLGMLYADGNVMKSKGCFSVKLKHTDREILEKLRSEISYTGPLRDEKDGDICALVIHSVALKQQLIRLGCVPNKSLVLTFPNEDQVPPHLLRHFIRGYYDGDGGLHITKKHKTLVNYFVGTKPVCDGIQSFLLREIGIRSHCRITNKNRNLITHTVSFCCQRSEKFLDFIYEDAEIYMERKFNLYRHGMMIPRKCGVTDVAV